MRSNQTEAEETPQTYKAVIIRCKAMAKRGVPADTIADRRAAWTMAIQARYKRVKELRMSVPVHSPERLDALRNDIAKAYNLRPDALYDRTRGPGANSVITRSRRAFVVAARKVGFSTTELAIYLRRPGMHNSVVYMTQTATADEHRVAAAALLLDAEREASRRRSA